MARTNLNLTELPDEILRSICFVGDWKDAISLQATCRRFRYIADEHLLWKYYCQTSVKYWHSSHQISRKLADPSYVQWKQLFLKHLEAGVKTRSALEDIISDQRARTPKIEGIVALGYDSKHALLTSYATATDFDDHLARRYWSHVVLGCLHRSIAVEVWAGSRNGDPKDDTYERVVGAFDLFVLDDAPEGDLDDIPRRLDEYVDGLRRAYPAVDEQSPRQRASTAAEYLIRNNLIALPSDRHYHSIDHNFLGRALFSQEKNSLPIITVIIYCYVVRQLGLSASPCGFPLHVHAIVQPPPGVDFEGRPLPADADLPSMYMDPFHSSIPVPISSLYTELRYIAPHLSSTEQTMFLSASSPREIGSRCARNITNSLHQNIEPVSGRPIDGVAAHYAAVWALVLLPEPLRQNVPTLMHLFSEKFPHDAHLIEKYIFPLLRYPQDEHVQLCRSVLLEDLSGFRAVKRRSGNPHADGVEFKVGQVFRHKRYGYTAVVTGWDGQCDAGEEWIQRNGVDRLDGGRSQAFYHALVQYDKSMRYVAAENIQLLAPDDVVPDAFPIEIGKFFKRWDDAEKVFASNIRTEYPDD